MVESIEIKELSAKIKSHIHIIDDLKQGMHKNIIGQHHLIKILLNGLLSDGHILLEGVPGLAKTLAIKTLSQLIHGNFNRIQFTPDLLPSDLIGTLIYSQKEEVFKTKKGPIFSNFILADEINRAPAKVQSALLEAMQENQVTIGEATYQLPHPFLVLATQNPIEQEGTYQLPEAQIDRFMFKVVIDYPKKEEEKDIIQAYLKEQFVHEIAPILELSKVLELRNLIKDIYIDDKISQYIVDIVYATREPQNYNLDTIKNYIGYGGSPRASINLAIASRTNAFLEGRGYVIPEDVKEVAYDILRHRIGLTYEAEACDITVEYLIDEILRKVEVP